MNDVKPRMTAEEADARFAALVAEHRGGAKAGARGRAAGASARSRAGPILSRTTIVMAVVYLTGVGAATFFRAAPIVAVILGGIVVIAAHFVLAKDA